MNVNLTEAAQRQQASASFFTRTSLRLYFCKLFSPQEYIMVRINDNFIKLPESYLFSTIARKVREYKEKNPDKEVISLGIGDVTLPIVPTVLTAMQNAVADQGAVATFHGYGPEQGYDFLRDKIARHDYHDRGIEIESSDIFISDGAKSDLGNIGDIFSTECRVAVTDPVYPVYVDTNAMIGRAGDLKDGKWERIEFLPCTEENGFVPALPAKRPDLIYLCYPNNPTGTTLTKYELKKWVDYARENKCVILYDSAYEAYISEKNVPHSIYEIEGAKEVAIEFRSFSKTAGFTGLRCGYTVVPKELFGVDAEGNKVALQRLWNRRQTTKFNGASYVIQRGAEAVYTPEGRKEIQKSIDYYMLNAKLLRECVEKIGLKVYGGINAPYVWVKTPEGVDSWSFFHLLLEKCNIVCTPGVGFGSEGEGFVRLTAFNTRENTEKAVERLKMLKLK